MHKGAKSECVFVLVKGRSKVLNVGHVFVYGVNGVCKVEDICIRDCGGGKKEYYVLQPVYDSRSTVYVPTDSQQLAVNMRELLTEKEIYDIIDDLPNADSDWIKDDKERCEVFRSMLDGGARTDLARVIRMLYMRKRELAERGKKLRSSDETVMQRAEKLLYGEFAWVLGIKPTDVVGFISKRIEPGSC